jgi:hypothetical protein
MYFCFVLSELGVSPPRPNAHRISGQKWCLDVIRSDGEGPFYPHVASLEQADHYAFFAGRVAGVAPSTDLPADHAVSNPVAEDWTFPAIEPGGSWIALKFDRRHDRLSIASDLFLLQRWYYGQAGGRWYFSNSLLFLRRVVSPPVELDERGVPYILLFGYLPQKFTPLKNVFSVRPAQALTVENGQARLRERCSLPLRRISTPTVAGEAYDSLKNEIVLRALDVLRGAVRSELQHVHEVLIPISGGLDSRMLLACALEVLPRGCLQTFTYGCPNSQDMRIGAALARALGLRHIALPMDERPLDEILADSFPCSEGMNLVFPNYPIGPLRELFPPGVYVLSGYLGETVWGVEDLYRTQDLDCTGDPGEHLFRLIWDRALQSPWPEVRRMLNSDEWGAFGYRQTIVSLPGDTIDERYSRWFAGDRDTNRINFSLQMHRDRAFFLAPHANPAVVEFAHRLPVFLRRRGVAYFSALQVGFPSLYRFPTTRNFGYPLGKNVRLQRALARRWWKVLEKTELAAFRLTGQLFFNRPFAQYAHPQELNRQRHRTAVLRCLDELDTLSVLDPKGVAGLRDRYRKRQPYPPQLLRSLVAIQQWIRHYRA